MGEKVTANQRSSPPPKPKGKLPNVLGKKKTNVTAHQKKSP